MLKKKTLLLLKSAYNSKYAIISVLSLSTCRYSSNLSVLIQPLARDFRLYLIQPSVTWSSFPLPLLEMGRGLAPYVRLLYPVFLVSVVVVVATLTVSVLLLQHSLCLCCCCNTHCVCVVVATLTVSVLFLYNCVLLCIAIHIVMYRNTHCYVSQYA